MRRDQRLILMWLGVSVLGVLTLSPALLGQASADSESSVPVTTDWSHHHVIFSQPATAEEAERVQRDPRYWQQLSRLSPARLTETDDALVFGLDRSSASLPGKNQGLNRDWSQDLGSGASVTAGNFPAKFSFTSTNANCAGAAQPDFVVYSTSLAGGAQASIVAYDNLYSGCLGTVPSVYWAYDTGATILTSPVFSRDGTQVAFVQSNSLAHGVLVLLKWVASNSESVSSPGTPTNVVSPTLYPTCTTPCMFKADLSGGGFLNNDTNSSIFYDYSNDVAYVGDDAGWLHKFTPFFLGAPHEVTVGWPVQVNPGSPTALTSPVHDFATGNVFVTDTGGFLYLVNSSTAAVTVSGQLDFSSVNDGGPGIVQGPIVDSTAGKVYVFAPSDGSGGCPIGIGGADCTAVFQLTTSFIAGDTGSEAVVGSSTNGTVPSPLYIGAFDSTYENSVNATGNLYVCGNTGGDPILYQVAINSGAFGTVTAGPVLSTSFTPTPPCSPVTDVLNPNVSGGATEWIFASAQNGGASSGCSSGGCIFNFKDTPWKKLTAYTVGQEVLDSHFQIQVVSVAGTSGATAPGWATIAGHSTTDGTVHWLDQGLQSAFTLPGWLPSHGYSKGTKILDSSNNVQLVTSSGTRTSGGGMPTFNATAGLTTSDGTGGLVWTNLGALGTTALAATGGTSGIIIDNIVGSATEPGASQIYFSTLSDQVCGTSGTGGCAVQASQPALQ